MLMPKRTKYRRPHRVSYEGRTKGGDKVSFGEFGLVATEGAWITSRQIEAARIAINRYMNRGGKVWIRIFPHLAKTKKPLEVRMGSGKGSPEEWVAVVKQGCVMFEMAGTSEAVAREAFRLASHKLPIKSVYLLGVVPCEDILPLKSLSLFFISFLIASFNSSPDKFLNLFSEYDVNNFSFKLPIKSIL